MKNVFKFVAIAAVVLCSLQSKAQSLSDLFGSSSSSSSSSALSTLVDLLTGGETLSDSNVTGDWIYSAPAVVLESEDLLASAAASALTSKVEEILATYFAKAGIEAGKFQFTLGSGSSFSYTISGKTVSGTYTINSSDKTMTFKSQALSTYNIASMTAYVIVSGSEMSILFEADKILSIASSLASDSSSSTISTINSLLSSFDAAYLGLKFSKDSTTSTSSSSSSSSTTDKVSSALKSLF
ncbi:MAG: DUF4923 family protein [Rikenellaceae bacterium]